MLALAAAPALAGPPSATVQAVQAAAGVAALDAGGIRFTAVQPMGRGATIFEAHRGAGGVTRTTIDLSPVSGGAGWAVDGHETKPLAGETLDYVTGLIDAATKVPADAACPDGPDYYAEHGGSGVAGCAVDHPNAGIARALGLAEAVAP